MRLVSSNLENEKGGFTSEDKSNDDDEVTFVCEVINL